MRYIWINNKIIYAYSWLDIDYPITIDLKYYIEIASFIQVYFSKFKKKFYKKIELKWKEMSKDNGLSKEEGKTKGETIVRKIIYVNRKGKIKEETIVRRNDK